MARVVSHARGVRPHEWIIGLSAAGYTAFLIMLALRYRDYSFFKPIHAFAGLLAFLTLFGRACDRLYSKLDGHPAVRAGDVLLGAVIVLYALDCTLLAVQLLQSCRSA
jgi:S-formylglutathione hydrolase FrmB